IWRTIAWVRAGSPASSARMTRTGCPARPPLALTYDAQARMAGGTVPVTAPRIPEAAPNDPSRISDFGPPAATPGTGPPAGDGPAGPALPAAAPGAWPAPAGVAASPAAGAPAPPVCLVRTPFAACSSAVCSREPQAVAASADTRRATISGGRVFIRFSLLGEAGARFAPCVPL